SFNRDPVWVSGTQNNTQVRVDFDADGLWDFIDTNSDNCPDNGTVAGTSCRTPPAIAGCTTPTANMCVYVVNAPGSAGANILRLWDPFDFDNKGTRIVSNRPVAVAWGEDVDQGTGSDPSPDAGYNVYPPIAVDLVLGIEKTVRPARVPLGGGVATYTVDIFA